jgi:hypothetical protein
MSSTTSAVTAGFLAACLFAAASIVSTSTRGVDAQSPPAVQRIDLAERLAAGKLRAVNREVTKLKDRGDAVHVSEKADPGLVWIDGTDFTEGTIELEVRGRDLLQRSFIGIAFHGNDDRTYESVYVRPFNFRATEPDRHQHAVQYMVLPDFDWPRLRQQFPEEFENPVHPGISPTDWVPLRVGVTGGRIRVIVGLVANVTLEVRKLGTLERGMVGLWTGNNSDGDFANLRITPAK